MDTELGFRPPYMSFQTFWNYIEELAEKPLPPAIDRSIMKSKSGTDQANLAMAFTSFGLTDPEGNVQPMLIKLAEATREERPSTFATLVHTYYTAPLTVSAKNGTPADLNKVFTDEYPSIASADTRRKAITFFLHAARKAGIELSPHFPVTRGGQGAPGVPKAKRSTGGRRKASGDVPPQANASHMSSAFSKSVEIPDVGTVTLSANVNPMGLKGDVRNWFYGLVDLMDSDAASGSSN